MASISDIVMQQVKAAAGNIELPSSVKSQALGGLSDSILKSLSQTASSSEGVEQIKQLLTGKSSAAAGNIAKQASEILSKNLSGLNLGSSANSALTSALPAIVKQLGGSLKDMDGDGDVDINDIILSLTGGSNSSSILGAAKSILGSILKK